MKVQKNKVAGLKAARFELKRMELLRYHNAPVADLGCGNMDFWLIIMLSLLLAPTTFIKPKEKKEKE